MTARGEASYGTMFSSLLRRPRRGPRRLDIHDFAASSPSPLSQQRHIQYADRTHATADFTEADDDDEDTIEEDLAQFDGHDDQANDRARERERERDQDRDQDEDLADQIEDDEADEDNRHRGLPVLPLFSATHLGKRTPSFLLYCWGMKRHGRHVFCPPLDFCLLVAVHCYKQLPSCEPTLTDLSFAGFLQIRSPSTALPTPFASLLRLVPRLRCHGISYDRRRCLNSL